MDVDLCWSAGVRRNVGEGRIDAGPHRLPSSEANLTVLSPVSAGIVRVTLPVVRDHAVRITGEFHPSLLAAHPELLDLFNQGNQANGEQCVASASAAVAFAGHLLEPDAARSPSASRTSTCPRTSAPSSTRSWAGT
ncbi:hypothetical protein ACFYOT_31120 [Saccharothrix saharensis]|uniref:hypothetical protein n=1 Tax=Saccharothrix saharensis TaxID=571190 RepID=UPI00368D0143